MLSKHIGSNSLNLSFIFLLPVFHKLEHTHTHTSTAFGFLKPITEPEAIDHRNCSSAVFGNAI